LRGVRQKWARRFESVQKIHLTGPRQVSRPTETAIGGTWHNRCINSPNSTYDLAFNDEGWVFPERTGPDKGVLPGNWRDAFFVCATFIEPGPA
jgi:hypothetical protein